MSEVLQSLSKALAETVENVGRSVVRIEGRRRLGATGIVWSADGVIVTANHVVERDDNLKVILPDGQSVSAALAGRDPSTDLAILRVEGTTLTPPQWVEPSEVRVGHIVLAVGRSADNVMATLGIISALEDSSWFPGGTQIDKFIQTDVVMYPGFSGGPLVSASGGVIGLNSSALARGSSMTIPVTTLRRVVATLMQHGKMRRGFLGVGVQPVRLPGPAATQLGQETGLMVMSVEAGSTAEQGNLYLGDTIVGIDGKIVKAPEDLIGALTGDLIGKPVAVKIVRSGQVHELQIVVGERK